MFHYHNYSIYLLPTPYFHAKREKLLVTFWNFLFTFPYPRSTLQNHMVIFPDHCNDFQWEEKSVSSRTDDFEGRTENVKPDNAFRCLVYHETLPECLNHRYQEHEHMDDKNRKWKISWELLNNVPPIAIFQLMFRKSWLIVDDVIQEAMKDDRHVEIQETLTWPGNTNHLLRGIICHIGESHDSGHYISFIKRDNQWYEHNDDLEKKISFQDIKTLMAYGNDKTSTSFTLMYVNEVWRKTHVST